MSNYPAARSEQSKSAFCFQNLVHALARLIAALAVCGLLGAPSAHASVTATTTTLAISPASPVTAGTVVTLTATVRAAGLPIGGGGTILFCDTSQETCTGTAFVGTGQVTSAGTASIKLVPSIGSHTYYAIYLGDTTFQASQSANSVFVVTGTFPTTTTISSSGSAGNYSLTGTVVGKGSASLAPTGSVDFEDTTNSNFVVASGAVGSSTLAQTFISGVAPITGTHPSGVAGGDFNNDGFLDVAIVNQTAGTVSVFLGNGDGTFSAKTDYTVGTTPVAVAVADIDNDGTQDLIVVNGGSNNISVLTGKGDGTFNAQATTSTGQGPASIAIGDFNGDGFLDVAVSDDTDGKVGVLLNDGSGGFAAEVQYTVGNGPDFVAVGDFNNYGISDLAVVNNTDGTVSVLTGNADGTFNAAATTNCGAHPVAIAVGDYDNDGHMDLAIANSSANTVNVLLNSGTGTFPTAVPYSTGHAPASIAAADFDRDGVLDLAVANTTDNTASVLLGNANGTFQAQTAFATGTAPVGIVAGDFNGDGNPDIVAANSTAATASVLLNKITQTVTASANNVTIPGTGTAHLIQGVYAGDANFASSTSFTRSLTSSLVTTALVLAGNPASSTYGDSVTLTATLSPSTEGSLTTDGETITFKNGAATLGTGTLAAGVATLTLATLPAGTDSLTAVYAGDANFAAKTSTAVNYVVAKADLLVTAQNASKVYGAALPAFTATITGFVNGDTQASAVTGSPSLTTTATAASPVGPYTITAAQGTLAASNYVFSFTNGTLTVTKAPLTVTAQNATKVYGAALPAFTASYASFVNGDTAGTALTGSPSFTTTATAASPAGSYTITAAVGTLAATNYTLTFVNGTLTVTAATLTVTAQDASRAYGSANPAFTANITGFVNGDTQLSATTGAPGVTTTATAASPAGTYTITAAVGTLTATNYTFTFVNGTLTVTKVSLTVTAQNASRAFGVANPTFTDVITGFVNGDTQAVVTGSASLTTTAITSSPVGSYPITAAIGTLATTSYTFTFVNATLTVTQATPTITWTTPAAITFGTALSATQLDATASTAGTFVYNPAAGATPGAGSVTLSVTFTPTDAVDFATAMKSVTLMVNKATPTITWATPAAVPSATALTGAQLDATASVAGTLVYTPAAGAVPADGLDTLSVTFTPTDAADYNTATATVVLTVGDFFALSITGTGTDEMGAHGTGIFRFQVSPGTGEIRLPGPVMLTLTGLPAGGTATFSPVTVAAGSGPTIADLSIRFAKGTTFASAHAPVSTTAPFALGMLMLPALGLFFMGKGTRRIPQRLAVALLALASLGTAIGLTSCAGTAGPPVQTTLNLVLTATSGNLQHTSNLTLIVNHH